MLTGTEGRDVNCKVYNFHGAANYVQSLWVTIRFKFSGLGLCPGCAEDLSHEYFFALEEVLKHAKMFPSRSGVVPLQITLTKWINHKGNFPND